MRECRYCGGMMRESRFRKFDFLRRLAGMYKFLCTGCGRRVILKPTYFSVLQWISLKSAMPLLIVAISVPASIGAVSLPNEIQNAKYEFMKNPREAAYQHFIFRAVNGDRMAYVDYVYNHCLFDRGTEESSPEAVDSCIKKSLGKDLREIPSTLKSSMVIIQSRDRIPYAYTALRKKFFPRSRRRS